MNKQALMMMTVLTIGMIFFSGCASTAVTVYDVPQFPVPNETMGLVYFYRPSSFAGAVVSYDIKQGNETIGAIKNGTYFYRYLEPANYQFWAKTEARKDVYLEVEANKTFYIKCGVGFGFFVGRPTFTVVPEITGKNEIKGCKYAPIKKS